MLTLNLLPQDDPAIVLERKRAKQREIERRYRDRHREEINSRRRGTGKKRTEYQRKWRAANPGINYDTPEGSRRRQLKRLYGITLERYNEMLVAQEGKCASCQSTSEVTLHVDHDHTTGKIRGLLCHSCNTALGLLKDDPGCIDKLLQYAKNHV